MTNQTYEYELVDIKIELNYQIPEETIALVREEEIMPLEVSPSIERDRLGIPMGQSMPEIKERGLFIK